MWGVSRCQAGLTLVSGPRDGAPPPSLWGQNGSNFLPVRPPGTCPSPHLLWASWARMSRSHVPRSRQGPHGNMLRASAFSNHCLPLSCARATSTGTVQEPAPSSRGVCSARSPRGPRRIGVCCVAPSSPASPHIPDLRLTCSLRCAHLAHAQHLCPALASLEPQETVLGPSLSGVEETDRQG